MSNGTKTDTAPMLAAVPYFSGLDQQVIAEIAKLSRHQIFESGAEIIAEGGTCHGLYVVLEGQVRLIKTSPDGRDHILWVLGPGATFNDAAVFDGGPNPETAVAVGRSVVALIPKAQIDILLSRYPEVGRAALRKLAERHRSLASLVEDLALRDVRGRVARLLLGCIGRSGHIVEKAELACTHVTHKEIASMVGSVREVVQRVLKDLEKAGAIELKRGEIKVRDMTVLERMIDAG